MVQRKLYGNFMEIYYSVIKNCGKFLRTYGKYELIWDKRLKQK